MAPRRNYDQAFRAKVVADAIRDGNWCKVARQHGIHESTVRTWLKSSDRHSKATRNNPISVRRAARRAAMTASRTTRVPRSTVATRPRIPLYPIVETGVVQFIDRKRIEEGFRFTRKKIIDEAKRISRENGLNEFQASIGWYNRFMNRNALSTAVLNRGVPIADQPITPPENQDQPGLDQAVHPQGEPGAQSEGETGAFEPVAEVEVEASQSEGETGAFEPVPEVEVEASQAPGETGHDQSPDDSQNFQEVALKTNDLLDQLLNLELSQVAKQSLGSNQQLAWLSNSNEEEEGRVNQDSNDGESLINQLITYQLEQIENMDFSSLDVPTVGSDVVAHHSSPPWCPGYKRNFLEHSFG